MRIAILQTDIKWADAKANQANAERHINDAGQADLYVLPEMWSTGFATEPQGIAESHEGSSLEWMKRTASGLQAAIAGSLAVRTSEGDYRNRHYFVYPDGSYTYYDKHHLFSYGHEDQYYTPGTKRTVAEYRGVRFLLATCYDARFPLWLRYNNDYDAIILAANWPANRQEAWQTLTLARAIENQCLVVAANRTGSDPYSDYIGQSRIIDAYGQVLAEADGDREQCVCATFDMERQQAFRQKFPVLRERDTFSGPLPWQT
ncbi:MAG: nitrilase family protein [Prevotella sp.]|nr:nitrilase family protein [Prevotella sp.]